MSRSIFSPIAQLRRRQRWHKRHRRRVIDSESPPALLFWDACAQYASVWGMVPEYYIGNYRVDFALTDPRLQIVVEIDGYQYHADEEAIERDAARDEFLRSVGWEVIRFNASTVLSDAGWVVAQVRKKAAGRLRRLPCDTMIFDGGLVKRVAYSIRRQGRDASN